MKDLTVIILSIHAWSTQLWEGDSNQEFDTIILLLLLKDEKQIKDIISRSLSITTMKIMSAGKRI
jgi:hypothetical protein